MATFESIIGDVRSEINQETRLALLNDDVVMSFIADALQEISENLGIEAEVKFSLIAGEKDYDLGLDHEIRRITSALTAFSGFTRTLSVESIHSLAEFRDRDEELIAAFTNWSAPKHLILWRDEDLRRIIRVYPTPLSQPDPAMEIEMTYTKLLVSDLVRENHTLTDEVPVPREYQFLAKTFVKARVYEWLEDLRSARTFDQKFYEFLRDKKRKRPFSKRKYINPEWRR